MRSEEEIKKEIEFWKFVLAHTDPKATSSTSSLIEHIIDTLKWVLEEEE